jgi:hypothetical protein
MHMQPAQLLSLNSQLHLHMHMYMQSNSGTPGGARHAACTAVVTVAQLLAWLLSCCLPMSLFAIGFPKPRLSVSK